MPVLDYQDKPDGPIMVMPYYPNGHLKGYVSESRCVKVLLQLLLGLRHLHGRGVIHRDIKPQNILVGPGSDILIADFGLSKFAEDKLFTTFCGTLAMVAPEVFPVARASLDKYGPKADVWSAGVLVAQFYLSRPPSRPSTDIYREGGHRENQWHVWNEEWT